MQVVKMSFTIATFLFLCSFSGASKIRSTKIDAKYKANLYEQFLSKFTPVTTKDDLILDVRIHPPLPVSEAEFLASNSDRMQMKKVIQERLLMNDFDLFISEISKKGKGGTRPHTYEAEYLLKQTNKLDILIYSEYQDARMYSKNYYLAVFNKMGVILAKEYIGMSNESVYTEAKLSNQLMLDVLSVLDGQSLPLSTKKLKVQKKGNAEVLEIAHPYLDQLAGKTLIYEGIKNYRLE